MYSTNYTVVTAFFNIKRNDWNSYSRSVDEYFNNATNMLSINDYIIIFTEPEYEERVKEIMKNRIYKLVIMDTSQLYWYPYYNTIENIMNSPDFKNGLKNPICPEVCKPLYDIIMYSKTKLVKQAIEMNPFNSTHFVWLDFGVHQHMFRPDMKNKKLLPFGVYDKIRFLCRDIPTEKDLNISQFFKSNENRFAGTMFTGSKNNLLLFDKYLEEDILEAFNKNVVDCDQSFFSNVYVKHSELFELYFGDWAQLITNYYECNENTEYIHYLLQKTPTDTQLMDFIKNSKFDYDEKLEEVDISQFLNPDDIVYYIGCGNKVKYYDVKKMYLIESHPALFKNLKKYDNCELINTIISNENKSVGVSLGKLITTPIKNDKGVHTKLNELSDNPTVIFINCNDFINIIKSGLKKLINKPLIIVNITKEVYEKNKNLLLALGYPFQSNIGNLYIFSNENKQFNNKKKIKLMCNWLSNNELCRLWEKMNDDSFNIITTPSNDCDYYVIINKPLQNEQYDPKKTIVFRMEPDTETNPDWDWFLQKGEKKEDFMFFGDLSKHMNNNEWHLSLNYRQLLESINKTKILSAVVSGLNFMDGHRFRIGLVQNIVNKTSVDVYGKGSSHLFKNHLGELPYHQKDDGVLPYKYHIAIENCSKDNYFTEKLIDGILGECLCFYWGCSNIDKYFDTDSFIQLPFDIEKSIEIITKCIENNEYEKRIDKIKEMKMKILNEYQFFARVKKLIY